MWIKKLTIAAASCIMTVGVVAAAAPPVKPPVAKEASDLNRKLNEMSAGCAQAYQAYKHGDDGQLLLLLVQSYTDTADQGMILLICRGYGDGYEDGRRGIS